MSASPMTLDIPTLIVAATAAGALLVLVLLVAGRSLRGEAGFDAWIGGVLASLLGYGLIGLRAAVPDVLAVVGGNGLLLAGAVLFNLSVARFRRVRAPLFPLLLLAGVALPLLGAFRFVVDAQAVRIAVAGVALGLMQLNLVRLLIGGARRRGGTWWLLTVLAAGPLLALPLRAADLVQDPVAIGVLTPDAGNALLYLALLGFFGGGSVALLALHLERRAELLEASRRELERLSRTDPLTGLVNRRALAERLVWEVARARRYGRPLALVLLDLDRFKQINDRYGHPTGDRVLVAVASLLRRELRRADLAARIGGEEFALVLPETSLVAGSEVAERLRKALATIRFGGEAEGVRLSASFGVAELGAVPDGEDPAEGLQRRADDALYRAKHGGRDRVETAAEPLAATPG